MARILERSAIRLLYLHETPGLTAYFHWSHIGDHPEERSYVHQVWRDKAAAAQT
jgi:hypothetical protein